MTQSKKEIPVQCGDTLELVVETLASSGDGIARHEGYTVFVPEGLTGDRVQAEIIKVTPRFGVAKVLERLESTPHRIESACPVFPECGGCRFQDLNYEQQMAFKVQVVKDAFGHIGKLELNVPVRALPAEQQFHYRNKASFALEKRGRYLDIGFYRQGTHSVVDCLDCNTLQPAILPIKNWMHSMFQQFRLSIYDEKKHEGYIRGLVIRHSITTGESLVGIVTNRGLFRKGFLPTLISAPELKQLGIVGILQNFNPGNTNTILGKKNKVLFGRDHLIDEMGGIRYRISLGSFFQVNPYQTAPLYNQVKDWVGHGKGTVVDAYAGNGGISLWLAKEGIKVTAVEEFAPAVEDAKASAQLNNITTCTFLSGAMESQLEALEKQTPIRAMVVDPPRKGLSDAVVDAIPRLKPQKLVYVSCNPATLARDLAKLEDYTIKDMVVVDLFPQTQHVETAVLLEYQKTQPTKH